TGSGNADSRQKMVALLPEIRTPSVGDSSSFGKGLPNSRQRILQESNSKIGFKKMPLIILFVVLLHIPN
ncbi:MAG: hypothetical protein RR331_05340, partial [Bacteroides sp.]